MLLMSASVYPAERHQTRKIRVALAQLAMRPLSGVEELHRQTRSQIETLAAGGTDIICFPDFVNAPLLASWQNDGAARAFRRLAESTWETREFFREMALQYQVNIVTGSLPLVEGSLLYQATYLCHRDGRLSEQRRIHATPCEEQDWEMVGGDDLSVFDTDAGKIGILLCYDIEFPELGRLLAAQGLQILFVPFRSDSACSYHRLRCCAQARAIENECYVAIAGSVGSVSGLPGIAHVDSPYVSSAVFSPGDHSFSDKAIISEAPAGAETVLHADLDLSHLDQLHRRGQVTNLRQRRTDLYRVGWTW